MVHVNVGAFLAFNYLGLGSVLHNNGGDTLTGRIGTGPHNLIRTEVLEPQLRYELEHLLPWYVRLEKVLLVEYHRMGLLTASDVGRLDAALGRAGHTAVQDVASESMSDIAFALERFVSRDVVEVPAAWHVDRSRNDLQATAQLLHGRDRLLDITRHLLELGRVAVAVARDTTDVVMPGYTHLQPAQVISPAFYLSALAEQVVHTAHRLDAVYRTASTSPLGAGAMSGQELGWDRARMARLLGLDGVAPHALRAVAQRDWALEATAELSMLGVAISRFTTDLMTWAGAGHGFVDLPDAWAGISSAMPQKKNFPVLERIRARTAHLTSAHLAVALGQRNTPYSNSVEVSKEASAQVPQAFGTAISVLRLMTSVLANLTFDVPRMREACRREHLGGFTLANLLTLRCAVPWRTAQVIAGRYVVGALERGLLPDAPDAELLRQVAAERGHEVTDAGPLLEEAFGAAQALTVKRTDGSTHPEAVAELLDRQESQLDLLGSRLAARHTRIARGTAELDAELARIAERAPC